MSAAIKDGGPAFPGANPAFDGNWDKRVTVGGMTMRQYYKAAAMKGLIASGPKALGLKKDERHECSLAGMSATMADAMLAEDEEYARK
jgi:hypothetical protein